MNMFVKMTMSQWTLSAFFVFLWHFWRFVVIEIGQIAYYCKCKSSFWMCIVVKQTFSDVQIYEYISV